MFKEKRFLHLRHFPPPNMPFGPGMIKEMSQLVFLWTISEEPNGITGYELQKNYSAKQTNVYRVLKEMEDEKLLKSEETIGGGRAHKLYFITDEGKEYLKLLRERWTYRIAFLTDIIPPEYCTIEIPQQPPPRLLQYVNEFNDKNEAVTFLADLETKFNFRKKQLEHRLERLERNLKEINETSVKIKSIENPDSKEIKEILKQLLIRNR